MTEKERLDAAKQLAKLFLDLPVQPHEDFGYLFVLHPFFETGALCDAQGLFQLDKDPERFEKYKEGFFEDYLCSSDSLNSLVSKVRKSYRVTFISYLEKENICTKKMCGDLLLYQWTSIESFATDVNVSMRKILSWLKEANPNKFMDKEEKQILQSLPETITVFRGVKEKQAVESFSWTLDKDIAIWFAERFEKKGYVYQAQIPKDKIIAYTNERGEKEIILNYHYLQFPHLIYEIS